MSDQEDRDAAVAHKKDRLLQEHAKLEEKVQKHEANPPSEDAAKADEEKLKQLTDEASKASEYKDELERELKQKKKPQQRLETEVSALKKELKRTEKR